MPNRLRQRPRDRRGLPIPYGSLRAADGTVDFRAIDTRHVLTCVERRRCWACAQKLTRLIWFVGGPLCATNRVFSTTAMHRECAEYALQVCPFLVVPAMPYSDLDRRPAPLGAETLPFITEQKPDRFMLGVTGDYRVLAKAPVLVRADPWIELHWWSAGREAAG